MLHATTLLAFSAAALVLLLIPGPAVLYIVSQSVEHGRRAGLTATLGVHTGTMVHLTAAALGLSAILVSSSLAFTSVKLLGAAYLIYLGLRALLGSDDQPATAPAAREVRLGRIFRQGVLVNVTNPKTALFFFAFLPQFLDRGAGRLPLQIALLGLVFTCIGLITDSSWALASGLAAGWIKGNVRFTRIQRRVSGCLFIGLGLVTALVGSERRG
jgi:threonine/homoserine/homoserine lactone efflux protein